jgi:uncharacterized protein (TIGR03089 family)
MDAHPEHLRRRILASAPGAPWVTYYDPDSGGRIELSAATHANWVAKAAGLLSEEFDVGPGSVVVVEVGRHWLLHVWTWTAWALGASVGLGDAVRQADVAVVAADSPLLTRIAPSTPVLACPTDALARPLGRATPTGAIDVMADIAGFPDQISLPLPAASSPAVVSDQGVITGRTAVETAQRIPSHPGTRLLVSADPSTVEGLLACTLSAATMSGSTILIDPGLAGAARDAIVAQERVDVEVLRA